MGYRQVSEVKELEKERCIVGVGEQMGGLDRRRVSEVLFVDCLCRASAILDESIAPSESFSED